MNRTLCFFALAFAVSGAAACRSSDCERAAAASPAEGSGRESGGIPLAESAAQQAGAAAANRAIAEADIVQLDDQQDRIYAISKSGTLAVVDAHLPGQLSLMGKVSLPGEPFEMYRRGDILLTMSNKAVAVDGSVKAPLAEDSNTLWIDDPASGAVINAVDVSTPGSMRTLASYRVPGEVADSRIVGNILYVATYESSTCWSCAATPRTVVTTFDVSEPRQPKQIDQLSFEAAAAPTPTMQTPWRRSVTATTKRLYIGGLVADANTTAAEGVIEVIDIADPAGHLKRGAKIVVSGPVMSRWQMDETDGYLRVVSQRGVSRTLNGEAYPDIDVFRVESSASIVRVGHTTMTLPKQEGLKSVRFDGARGYVITAYTEPLITHDPLYTIDFSNPALPRQGAHGLDIPGYVFHLEPRGDRLLGLGLDRNNPSGSLNVSLFNVANVDQPSLVQRVAFGPTNMWRGDDQVTGAVLAEDQDRIQKAFRIFSDGLIAVPYSGGDGTCSNNNAGVQLLKWTRDSLSPAPFLSLPGNPRRAIRRNSRSMQELIAISDSTVRAFALDGATPTVPLADLTFGHCVPRARFANEAFGMPNLAGNDTGIAAGFSGQCH